MMSSPANRPFVHSYGFVLLLFVLAAWFYLTTPLVAVLFSYLALTKLNVGKSKWLAVLLFVVLMAGLFYGFAFFLKRAFVVLPEVVSTAIPKIVGFATEQGIELPFSDADSFRAMTLEKVYETLFILSNFAKLATRQFVLVLVGAVIAVGIFFYPSFDYDCREGRPLNLYSQYGDEISARFRSLFNSFRTVIGAQVLISAVNTVATALFVFGTSLRYGPLVVILTFLCGLLPVIGNLISNTIIVGIAFTYSPKYALSALVFLVAIHKAEYFLNSKIIGSRIRYPMWLTLLALVLGERLMGIAGIVLAPVILHFIKTEASRIPAHTTADEPVATPLAPVPAIALERDRA